MKRVSTHFICILLSIMLCTSALPALAAGSMTAETLPLYNNDNLIGDITVYFLNGDTCVPYITVQTLISLLEQNTREVLKDKDYALTAEQDGAVTLLKRENGSECLIDFEHSTVEFTDYDAFVACSYCESVLDEYTMYTMPYFKSVSVFQRAGEYVKIDFAQDYDIHFVYESGTGYLPLQTASDLLFLDSIGSILYGKSFVQVGTQGFSDENSDTSSSDPDYSEAYYDEELDIYLFYDKDEEALYYYDEEEGVRYYYDEEGDSFYCYEDEESSDSEPSVLQQIFYAQTGERSEALVKFNYSELCFLLDFQYGLKDTHDITSFDALFESTGLQDDLLSDDPALATRALEELTWGYLADGHSGFVSPSFYTGQGNETADADNVSISMQLASDLGERFTDAQAAAYPDGVPFYEEIGDTAFVTIDEFTLSETDYYSEFPSDPDEIEDTIGKIIYANSRINRKNSPIKNVVLDLSCCPGGETAAGTYTVCWMLGYYAINAYDTTTGAQATNMWVADIDLDGVQGGEGDTISHLNLYCLISPYSFSCSNEVASALKESGYVVLLGQDSTGGACWVQTVATADGNVMSISSRVRSSYTYNGSFVHIDEGIEADVLITNLSHFFDRNYLAKFIASLP